MRSASVLRGALFAVCAAGCSGGDRPDPVRGSRGDPDWESAWAEVDARRSASATEARHACEPGTARECRRYFRDTTGRLQCPIDYELCSADGSEWLPCGEYDLDHDRAPVRRDGKNKKGE
jgi:hypothetical protein